ncbi:hypothetical protein RU07_17900 [Agrobacterium tumefaciens]|uniref:Uncharacterized protein n=1 Tax=Agrobacterium tumefaciens TaxID=358 RepID=A0A0D0KP96_AGRTU|nr:hypothetical protein RU07_17900 [Agrobacterium tumefaciens]
MTSIGISEETTTIQELPKKPWWMKIPSGTIVILVFLVGIAYVAYYLHILSLTEACKDTAGLTFFGDCVSKLKVNEIGDSLGGAFAPLAFIFLAGALIIQAFELASQRHEINETQAVMTAQLAVAREQVKETIASTALLTAQTNLFTQQHNLRLADDEFDKTLYRARLELMNYEQEFGVFLTLSHDNGYDLLISGQHSQKADDYDFFNMIAGKVKKIADTIDEEPFERVSFVNVRSWDYFRKLFARLSALTQSCSPAYESLAITYRTHDIHQALEELYGTVAKAEQNQAGAPDAPPPSGSAK